MVERAGRGRDRHPGPLSVAGLERLAGDGRAVLGDAGLLDEIAAEMAARGTGAAEICGDVYERRLAASRARRRASGSYYTPAYLVDFAVERALGGGPARGDGPVVDPACGGGAFLLACARRVGIEHVRGIDVDPTAVAVARLALAIEHGPPAAHRAVTCADALRGDERDLAAAVVGNPPWGQKGLRFDDEEAAYVRARYRTGRGVLDPFKLFVERGVELVRPGGCLALVLPDILLLKDQRVARDILLEETAIEWIADAGRAFPGVNLDAVVIVARKGPPPRGHRVAIWHRLPEDWRVHPPPRHELPQSVFLELDDHRLNLHLTEASLARLRALAPLPRLGELFEVHEGVHTGNVRAKLFRAPDDPPSGPRAPVIVGKDEVARYRLRWEGRWIDLAEGVVDRDAGEYANLGRRAWHERPKIVVRRTGDRIVAAFDGDGRWVSNNVFVVLPREPMAADEMRAWVAYLNSAIMTWYFRAVQPRTGRLFAELKIRHLVAFPVPRPREWRRVRDPLAAVARRAEADGEPEEAIAAEVDAVLAGALDPELADPPPAAVRSAR